MKRVLVIMFGVFFSFISSANAYVLIEPIATKDKMECWASSFPEYTEIIGYSSLGHVFMRSPKENDYIVLHPFKSAAKSYGEFSNIKEFESNILKDSIFKEYVLDTEHVSKIRKKLGKLKHEEVYIPEPYPFIGGDESVNSYNKGNIWVMLLIVGQFIGLCT